jgi:hypothetical protein
MIDTRGWPYDGRSCLLPPASVSGGDHQPPSMAISVFSLSLRDVELILAERGILVTHEGTGAMSDCETPCESGASDDAV